MSTKLLSTRPHWELGLLITRVVSAIMIIPYGMELFDSAKMNDLQHFLSSIGFPLAKPMSYLAKITELFGGICLGLGLLTRLVAIPLSFCMLVVIYTMGDGSIFNDQTATLFLLLFLSFLFIGPGKWSLDFLIFDRHKNSLIKT